MAGAKDVLVTQFQSGGYLIERFTADLSDEEYFIPPTDGANHVAWILGHIACSEDSAVSQMTGTEKRIPESMYARFSGSSTCLPDASKYPSRSELDDLFRRTRAATVQALKAYDERHWNEPSPDDFPKDIFPTMGAVWSMQAAHQFWHIGQITTCRTAMKKAKVLF